VLTTDVAIAAAALRRGELVAFATETVYGLGADATNDGAVAAIFEAKGRPRFNPLIVHVGDIDDALALGRFDADARRLAALWPGPLTLVVERAEDCPVSLLASAGLSSIAIRVPAHDQARALLRAAGCPVVAPSANPSGRISSTRARHVVDGLGDRVAVVLDGGECAIGVESTIVSCLGPEPVLLRPGGLPRHDIEAVLGRKLADPGSHARATPVAPGQLASHYAPRANLRLDAARPDPDEAWLGFGPDEVPPGPTVRNLSPTGDLREAAANLFRYLHELDDTGPATIAVAPVPETGLGEAINDRLRRAAAPRA